MNVGSARARAVGYVAAHGRTSVLRVFPQTKARIAKSATIEGTGTLKLGNCWSGGRYYASLAYFGPDSHITVSGNFAVYSNFYLGVADGARLCLGSGFLNTGSLVVVHERDKHRRCACSVSRSSSGMTIATESIIALSARRSR